MSVPSEIFSRIYENVVTAERPELEAAYMRAFIRLHRQKPNDSQAGEVQKDILTIPQKRKVYFEVMASEPYPEIMSRRTQFWVHLFSDLVQGSSASRLEALNVLRAMRGSTIHHTLATELFAIIVLQEEHFV